MKNLKAQRSLPWVLNITFSLVPNHLKSMRVKGPACPYKPIAFLISWFLIGAI